MPRPTHHCESDTRTPAMLPVSSPDASTDEEAGLDPANDPGWLTYADAAALAEKSIKTIARAVKEHRTVRGVSQHGRMYVCVADLITAGLVDEARTRSAVTAQDSVELFRLREVSSSLREELATMTGRLEARESEIERALLQLREKDTQIAKLMRIVEQQVGAGARR